MGMGSAVAAVIVVYILGVLFCCIFRMKVQKGICGCSFKTYFQR